MPYIVLTEEQAQIIALSKDGVEVRGLEGEVVAFLTPFDPEFTAHIEEAKRRHAMPGPRVPALRVEAMLQKFHEIDRTEGMTADIAQELVRRTVVGEPL